MIAQFHDMGVALHFPLDQVINGNRRHARNALDERSERGVPAKVQCTLADTPLIFEQSMRSAPDAHLVSDW
jgi:hypothetical protein